MIPPLIGFFSKQMVLYSAIQSGYYFMSIVAIIVSVISASYYLKIVKTLFSENIELNEIKLSDSINSDLSSRAYATNDKSLIINEASILKSSHSFLISTLTLIILLFILKPSLLLNSTQLLSLSLYNC